MDSLKKTVREGGETIRKAGRDADGHDLGDDFGNLGDEVKTRIENAGDDLRSGARNAQKEAERHQPR